MLNGKCKNTVGNRQYAVGRKGKSAVGSLQSANNFVLSRTLKEAIFRFNKNNDYVVIASKSSSEAISNSACEIAAPCRARNDNLNVLKRKTSSIFHLPFNIFHPQVFIKKVIPAYTLYFLSIIVFTVILAACNPFAPAYDENLSDGSTISDLTTTDGVFRNLQYAYTFKDTIIYGDLISQDFLFSFRNFLGDQVFDDSWGREEEMRATYGLFQNAQRVDLIWNNIILSSQDSLTANIIRGFNLTVTLNPTDILRVDGRVDMTLRKNPETNKWSITRWVDESNL